MLKMNVENEDNCNFSDSFWKLKIDIWCDMSKKLSIYFSVRWNAPWSLSGFSAQIFFIIPIYAQSQRVEMSTNSSLVG